MSEFDLQGQDVFKVASDLYQSSPDWVTFFREVLGVDGIIRRMYPDATALANFEQSEDYRQIQQMLAKLRERNANGQPAAGEPTRVITVRLPKSLHESLRVEAHERRTSMNKLCISKLLQLVSEELVPAGIGD